MTLHLTGRKYLRAAEARLKAVQLLRRHELNFEAIYLAGYVVECAMKALLLARTPLPKHPDLIRRRFAGRIGHSFDALRAELYSAQMPVPAPIAKDLLRLGTWSTDMRYEVRNISNQEAESFVKSVISVLEWAKRSF